MHNNEGNLLGNMMKAAISANLIMQKVDTQELLAQMFENGKLSRKFWEHHPSIETSVTDEDMLLLRIDMALDTGDEEMFMQLTGELKAANS